MAQPGDVLDVSLCLKALSEREEEAAKLLGIDEMLDKFAGKWPVMLRHIQHMHGVHGVAQVVRVRVSRCIRSLQWYLLLPTMSIVSERNIDALGVLGGRPSPPPGGDSFFMHPPNQPIGPI